MRKLNNGFKFDNMREYVEYFNLGSYIENVSSRKKGYGHKFEEHVYRTIRSSSDVFVRKTYADYDILKGGDLKFVFGDSSVLVDIKLNKYKAFKDSFYFLDEGLMLTRDREEVFYFPLSEDLEVAFSLKDVRKAEGLNGYCKFQKPIIVATFRSVCYEEAIHRLFTKEVAREFVKYIHILNMNMIRENMPNRDVASFVFRYNKKVAV